MFRAEVALAKDEASSIEVLPSGKSYRHAPRPAALRVQILALGRRKPPSLRKTWCDGLPTTSKPVAGPVHWSVVVLGLLLYACLVPQFFERWLLAKLWNHIVALVRGRQLPRTYRVMELDRQGVYLSRNESAACFVPYAALRSVQTYLDECVEAGARRGVILGTDGGRAFTLELGENTANVVNTICQYTQVKVLHSRCIW